MCFQKYPLKADAENDHFETPFWRMKIYDVWMTLILLAFLLSRLGHICAAVEFTLEEGGRISDTFNALVARPLC